MVSKRLVAINAASSVLVRILNVVVLLWMFQYLLKRIPTEEFAIYPVVTAVMTFAPLFFLVFTSGVSRYIVEAYAKDELARVPQIVSSIVPLLGGMSFGFLALGLVFAWFIDSILNVPPQMVGTARAMMAMLVASFSLRMLLLPFGAGFNVRQRYVELNLLGVARDALRITLLYILLTEVGPAVIWVVVATVIANLSHLAVVTYRSIRLAPDLRFRHRLFCLSTAKRLLSFGMWTTLGQLASIMWTNAATLTLNGYGTAVDVVNFHIGATCFRQLQSLMVLARLPLQTPLIAMHARDEKERLARTALTVGRYALWVALVVATPLAIYADELVKLYLGEKFADAALVLILFMIVSPFWQASVLLPMIAAAKAQVRQFNLIACVTTFVGVILMVVSTAVWNLGAVGVALAMTVVTIVTHLVYFWPLLIRLAGTTPRAFVTETLIPGLTPALASGAVWVGLQAAYPVESWMTLLLHVTVGVIVYLGALLAFCLRASDRDMLRALVLKVKPLRNRP